MRGHSSAVLQTARGMTRLLLLCLLLATGFNAAEGFAAPLMALKLPTNSPPVVICPGFGNDARDCESMFVCTRTWYDESTMRNVASVMCTHNTSTSTHQQLYHAAICTSYVQGPANRGCAFRSTDSTGRSYYMSARSVYEYLYSRTSLDCARNACPVLGGLASRYDFTLKLIYFPL